DLDTVTGWMPGLLQDFTVWNTSTTHGSWAMVCAFGMRMNRFINLRFIGMMGLAYGDAGFAGTIRNCIAQHSSTLQESPMTTVFPTADKYVPLNVASPPGVPASLAAQQSKGFLVGQGAIVSNLAIGFDVGFAYHGDIWFGGSLGNACLIAGNK